MRKIILLFRLARIYKDIHPRKSVFSFLRKAFGVQTEQLERVYDAMAFKDGIVRGGLY